MNCENVFCIYQTKGKCTITSINIDRFGMCEECVYPDIDDDILEQAKVKLLKKYQED